MQMNDRRLIPVPALSDNYVWLLADATGATVAVDPGEAAPVRAALARENLHLTTILLTHHHPDHIGAARELAAESGATIHAPRDARIPFAHVHVADGDRVRIAAPACEFEVLAIPGHTLSHVAFYGAGVLFCGDTLFSIGCGRLFEGTPAQMLASLDRLAALPGATVVCGGHEYTLANCAFALSIDPGNPALIARGRSASALRAEGRPTLPSSLDEERAANPFLRVDAPVLIGILGAGDRVERFAELRRRKDIFRAPS